MSSMTSTPSAAEDEFVRIFCRLWLRLCFRS
jgi:hypothetical protein